MSSDEEEDKISLTKTQKEMAKNISDLLDGKSKSPLPTIPKMRNIQKRILVPGRPPPFESCRAPGGGFNYPKETKFIFHYKIQYLEGGPVLDDSRKYGKTMELYSGKEFQLDWWESCLSTMFLGEVGSFTVPPERLFNFPAVNKKLRDYMTDNPHAHAKSSCCAGMAMSNHEKEGVSLFGYEDLDEYMKKPKALEFIFDLINIELPEENKKDTYIMNADERRQRSQELKERGNREYRDNHIDKAILSYLECLQILDQLTNLEKHGEPEWIELNDQMAKVNLNLAQAYHRQQQYPESVKHSTLAIERDPLYGKAYYRRAKSYFEMQDFQEAVDDLIKAQELLPDQKAALEKEINDIRIALAKATQQTHKLMKEKLRIS